MEVKHQDLSFKDGARVLFLGDSITSNGLFIAKIFDHYRTHLPERKVKLYNFGVPGDSAGGCVRMHRHELLLELNPTEVVLMFGMNDIGRHYYDDTRRNDPEQQKNAQAAKEKHTKYMKEIVSFLRERNLPVTLCSVTPYDEISDAPSANLLGCHQALTSIFEADKETLLPLGLKGAVDFGKPMNDLLFELKERALPSFIGPDRVHPTELGHDLMARIFLHAQSLLPSLPSVEDIAAGKASMPPLSDKNKARKEAEALWRSVSYFDFNLQWGQENMTSEERIAYWIERRKTMTPADGFPYTAAQYYPERKAHEKEYFELMLKLTDEMYTQ